MKKQSIKTTKLKLNKIEVSKLNELNTIKGGGTAFGLLSNDPKCDGDYPFETDICRPNTSIVRSICD